MRGVMCKNPEMDNADLEVPETWLEKFFGTQIGGAIGVASVVLTFLVTGLVFLGCWAYAIISVITFAIVQLVSPASIEDRPLLLNLFPWAGNRGLSLFYR